MENTIDRDVFDILIDNGDVLLVIYSYENEPDDPAVVLLPEENRIEFFRDGNIHLSLENIQNEVFEVLRDQDELMVCETEPTNNPDETEIVYSYYASIVRENDEKSVD